MASLLEAIENDSRAALKARDDLRLQALRMVLAQAKNARIEKGSDLTDAEIATVLQKAVKTRRDSVEQYRRGGREDLATKEEREIAVIEAYLPQPLTREETSAILDAIISEIGASGKKDLGRVMKELQTRHAGRVDNRLASGLAAEKLG